MNGARTTAVVGVAERQMRQNPMTRPGPDWDGWPQPGEQPRPWMWPSLIGDPSLNFPWPYTAQEAEAIGALLPGASREQALTLIVEVARRFLMVRRLKEKDPQKPAVGREIAKVSQALNELISSLEALSPLSIIHLEQSAHSWMKKEASFADLLLAAYTFRDANPGLETSPKEEMRGRAAETLRGWLLAELDRIFSAAHSTAARPRGRPAFIRAAITPLALPHVSDEAIEKALSGAKTRRKAAPAAGIVSGDN